MIPNNNLSVLPWYTSIEQQNARKWWAYGRIYPLFTPAGFILPFQIQLPITEERQIISWKIYDKTGNEVANLMSMQNLIIQKIINNQYSVLIFNGLTPIVAQMQDGQYYSYLEVDTDSQGFFELYSEIFTVVNDIQPYLKITWWNNVDFVMDAGTIVYNYADGIQFRNILYLPADIAKPEYIFEEEGETRDGYFFPIKQISEKRYHFSFLAPEYLLDVMRFIRMADYANIEYHGQTYSLDTFLITPEWEDDGDVAAVKAEFDTATVAKKISLGYVPAATVAVTGVSLSKTSLSLTEGASEKLLATVKPDNATNKSVTWLSSNDSVATVDASGKVTAVKAGTAAITVRTVDGGKTASCSVNVTAATVAVTGVSLSKTSLSLRVGNTEQITATVSPANATNKAVTWSSSNDSVATVDQSGNVTAVKAGTTTITVRTMDGGKTATCQVTAVAAAVAVTGVSLSKTSLSLRVGNTEQITATVSPSNATNKSVTWSSSDDSVATVDQSGNVTAVKAGTTTITVRTTDGGKTATCSVNVTAAVAVTGVSLDKTSLSLIVGNTEQITATVKPDDATDKSVFWVSMDERIATVDQSGNVTAVGAGTTTIHAVATSNQDIYATCQITAVAATVAVTNISVNNGVPISLNKGDVKTTTVEVYPVNATDKSITWSSDDESVASVSQSGVISAVASGSTVIRATASNGVQGTVPVNVAEQAVHVTGVTLSPAEINAETQEPYSLVPGGEFRVKAIISPANATNTGRTWVVGAVESYNEDGSVNFVENPVGFSWREELDGNIVIITTKEFGEQGIPEVYVKVTTDDGKFTEDKSYVVGIDAQQSVSSVVLDKNYLSLVVGQPEILAETVFPSSATNKSVTWSSSNDSVATVDASGKVTAVGAGTTTITVRTVDGGKTATCQVTVVAAAVAVTGVSLDKTSLSLVEGASEALQATVSPANATNKAVTWSSSNDSVATVDQGGNVTAVKAGTAIIMVRTVDGGKTATCSVNVTAAISIVDFILTDGACYIPLLNVKPKQDMVIVSSFYMAQDPGRGSVFYATVDGTIMMYIHQRAGRRIESWGYANDGARDIRYGPRPSEPTHYLLKQDFSGPKNYTAYYSNGGSPYLSSELDDYQVNNPNTRLKDGYTDSVAFPSDQCLSVFGRHDDAAGVLVAGSRFYGMKIWSGGNLVHDLVPAKKAAEYGIYDAVTQDFYTNAGTGNLHGDGA